MSENEGLARLCEIGAKYFRAKDSGDPDALDEAKREAIALVLQWLLGR